jgi:hypothetical protein
MAAAIRPSSNVSAPSIRNPASQRSDGPAGKKDIGDVRCVTA